MDTEFPTEDEGTLWWEVWLPVRRVRRDRQAVVESFRERAEAQGMRVVRGELVFLERTVLLVSASLEQMQHSMLTLNSVAELRRAKETAEFFDSLRPEEQQQWLDELLARTQFPADTDEAPRVCLLDTGVNRGHRFLSPALDPADLHTVEQQVLRRVAAFENHVWLQRRPGTSTIPTPGSATRIPTTPTAFIRRCGRRLSVPSSCTRQSGPSPCETPRCLQPARPRRRITDFWCNAAGSACRISIERCGASTTR